jgi:hypothetical protein
MNAIVDDKGPYLRIRFPHTVDISRTGLKDELAEEGFVKMGAEFSQVYVFMNATYSEQNIQAANLIKSKFNSGKREYCKELLTKTRIKHR